MSEINITVDINCSQPVWVFEERLKEERYDLARYRLYCNHDLLTERDWRWGKQTLVEDIWLEPNVKQYSIKLVPVLKNRAQASFKLSNLQVKDKKYKITEAGVYVITFTIEE